MTAEASATTAEQEAYYAGLGGLEVAPLWRALTNLLPDEPSSRAVPHLWRYGEIRPHLLRAGEVVSAEEAERRVLMLLNPVPELRERGATTSTLYAGLQLVLPGEVARCHHHTQAAFRFVVEGGEAFTVVDGEKTVMRPGDFVLTPSWRYHDHHNESDEPIIWLDGLDLPFVNLLEAGFYELHPDISQKVTKPTDISSRLFIRGRLNPVWEPERQNHSPIVNYPWREVEAALYDAVSEGLGSDTDGAIFEYTNPLDGGAVMPTLNAYIQALRPAQHTLAHRHTTSVIYHVVRGGGVTVIDGREFHWGEKDIFCIPGWASHEHVNGSGTEEAILFSYTNQTAYQRLGLYREEIVER